jgi:TnpA family transposase
MSDLPTEGYFEGVIRHCTGMAVDRQYVDSHGQSEVAFAFCRLLGFQLLPRLKNIGRQRLYRLAAGQPDAYPRLQHALSRPIDWELIRQQSKSVRCGLSRCWRWAPHAVRVGSVIWIVN